MNKRIYLIILLLTCICKFSTAQILCIYCYDQNDSISNNVNNLVLNGSFENGCPYHGYFCPNAIGYACDITNWICTGGGPNNYSRIENNTYTVVPDGVKAPYFGNFLCYPCSYYITDTSCVNKVDCTVMGVPAGFPITDTTFGTTAISLEQTVSGLVAGNIYVLEFWAGGENNFTKSGIFGVDVGFGDTLLRDKPTDPWQIGTRYIIEFNATSSAHTIKFTNWGHMGLSTTELIIDNVRLYTLAELSPLVPHCSLGINDVSTAPIMISTYPNPVTTELIVKTNSDELSEIILYDIASRKLLRKKFTNSTSINTEQLAKGIYLYEVRNKRGVIKKGKVVKD